MELNVQFIALKCVNLEHNQLTNFSGLIHLPNLKVKLPKSKRLLCIQIYLDTLLELQSY